MTQPPALPRASVAPTSLALFGPPPLLEGENAAAYDELLARVSGAMNPTDIFEEIWVRDVVDLAWETFRLRRLKSSLLAANAPKGLTRHPANVHLAEQPGEAGAALGGTRPRRHQNGRRRAGARFEL